MLFKTSNVLNWDFAARSSLTSYLFIQDQQFYIFFEIKHQKTSNEIGTASKKKNKFVFLKKKISCNFLERIIDFENLGQKGILH